MKFTKIPADTFQKLQINAGILTTDFTPATGTIGEAGQIGATTGGISYSATPTYKDYGEDIDNCPKNTKELIEVDSWEAKASGTFAIHLMNALSTGGFQMKTADKAKGQFAFEYTAHYSMSAQDTVPFEIYIKAGTAEA